MLQAGKERDLLVSEAAGHVRGDAGALDFAVTIFEPGWLVRPGGFCNAFCVAKDIVATSASCLVEDSGRWWDWRIEFKFVQYSGGTRTFTPLLGHARPSRQESIVLGRLDRTKAQNRRGSDWALLKLRRQDCKAVLQFDGQSLPSGHGAKDDLSVMSALRWTAADRAHGSLTKVLSSKCGTLTTIPGIGADAVKALKKLAGQTNLLMHTCDTTQMQIGSPVFQKRSGGEPRLIGIHSGHIEWTSKENETAGRRQAVNAGVRFDAVAPSLKRFRRERVATYRETQRIQRALSKLRLYDGDADANFDMGLRRAILKFEDQMQIPRLGLPTARLMNWLEAEVWKSNP